MKNPSDIAREALRQLASRQLPPTPANFQASYHEIAGLPDTTPFPEPQLRKLVFQIQQQAGLDAEKMAALETAIARRSWADLQAALAGLVVQLASGAERDSAAPAFPLAAKFGRLVECMLPAMGGENPRLEEMALELQRNLREQPLNLALVDGQLAHFSRQVLFAAEEQAEIKETLLQLMHLIIENIGDLVIEDSWLKGQIDGLLAVVVPPLNLRHLDEMERRLRVVIVKQSDAKARSLQAQDEMRTMLAAFIGRLATINESSLNFQGRIEASALQIEGAKRIEDLAPLLKDVISATRVMTDETASARDQLKAMQDKVAATEAELVQLHMELDNASALARHDPLTDALNRKGLDEALEREIATVHRKEVPLSICMLDIDNFKLLNDRLGHETGDKALIHLADMARRCMRPSDTLARYGGEEFVVLMPDTVLDSGVEAMIRLQRELTKAFFLSGKEKILITFSAGVAQLAPNESGSDAINRADQAMYLAKRAGKNRVMGG